MEMKPFDPNTQVLGKTLLSSITNLPSYTRKSMLKVLEEEGISNIELDTWYDLKIALAFYDQLTKELGPNTIYKLGKSVPEKATFPTNIDSIESGLKSINIAYNMNHKNGYVGFYKVVSHDLEEKKIIMQCYNPYPCDFDRGLITAMARKFRTGVRVTVDKSKPSKKDGGNESWYIIFYR